MVKIVTNIYGTIEISIDINKKAFFLNKLSYLSN